MEQAKGYQAAGSTGVPLVTKKTQATTGTNESTFRQFLVSLIECLKMFCCCCCPQDNHENNQKERERLITKKEDTEESTPLLKKRAEQAATSTEPVLTEAVPVTGEKKVTATTAAAAIQKADIPEIAPTRVDVFLSLENGPYRLREGNAIDETLTRQSLEASCTEMLKNLQTKSIDGYEGYYTTLRFELFCSERERYELSIPVSLPSGNTLTEKLKQVKAKSLAHELFETANRQLVNLALKNAWEQIYLHDSDYQAAKQERDEATKNSVAYNKGVYAQTQKQYQEHSSDLTLRKRWEQVQKEYRRLSDIASEKKKAFQKAQNDIKGKWEEEILRGYDGKKLVDHTFVRARLKALLSSPRV